MAAKKVTISLDAGTTQYTLPGDTGDLSLTATGIKDTVFGQTYESDQTGLIEWSLAANGMYKGFAGYVAKINKGGTPTTMSAEATTLVSGKTYRITNQAHQFIDIATAVTVFDGGVDHTADVLSIDYLFGAVTFKAAYTPTGAITMTGKYIPLTQIAKAQSFTLTQTAATIDKTDFPTAQANGGYKVMDYGLKVVSLDLAGFYAVSNAWKAALTARSILMIEINPDGSELSVGRGLFKPMSQAQAGKVGDLETETVKMSLQNPDPSTYPLLAAPFSWLHYSGTTLSTALQNVLNSWLNNVLPTWTYLYDGVNGQQGLGVITDCTLTGGLDVMNTFAVKVAGAGVLTAVGTG